MWRYTPVLNVCVQLLLSCFLGAVAARAGVVSPRAKRASDLRVPRRSPSPRVPRGGAPRRLSRPRALPLRRGVPRDPRARAPCLRRRGPHPRARFPNPRVHPLPSYRTVAPGDPTLASRLCETWLSLSWFSTIVVGLPVLTAALGDEKRAFRLALQAAISSFIFQLPGILLLLETHAAARAPEPEPDVPPLAARTLARLAKNPVLWGIASGVVLSITRAGAWLDAPSQPPTSASQNAAFVEATARSFGATVTPLGMFVTGAWMAHQGTGLTGTPEMTQTSGRPRRDTSRARALSISCPSRVPRGLTRPRPRPWPRPGLPLVVSSRSRLVFSLCVLFAKLIVVPAVTFALSRATGVLSREEVIGATLIASLPVSVASVVLTEKHGAPSGRRRRTSRRRRRVRPPATLAWCAALRA